MNGLGFKTKLFAMTRLFCFFMVLSLIVCAVGIVFLFQHLKQNDIPPFPAIQEDIFLDLPAFEPTGTNWLGILTYEPQYLIQGLQDLWIVNLSSQNEIFKKADIIDGLSARLVDCGLLSATLCVIDQSEDKKSIYILRRYDLLTLSNASLNPVVFPISVGEMSENSVIAVTPKGMLLMAYEDVYIMSEGVTTTLFDFASTTKCPYRPSHQLSSDGKWLAVLCVDGYWDERRLDPFQPLNQVILLISLDGLEPIWLETPPVYYFHADTIAYHPHPARIAPQIKWSPTGDEILGSSIKSVQSYQSMDEVR